MSCHKRGRGGRDDEIYMYISSFLSLDMDLDIDFILGN